MKKIEYLLMMVLSFCFFITGANADTIEDLTAELDKIPSTYENGIYYLDMPMLEISKIKDDSLCLVTIEDLKVNYTKWIESGDPEAFMPSDETLAIDATNSTNYCINTLKNTLIDYLLKVNDVEMETSELQITYIDDNHITIRKDNLEDVSIYVERNYTLRFITNYDENVKDSIDDVSKGIKGNYTIYGFQVINSVYHYGSIENTIYQNELVLYKFPELRQYIEDNKEYKFIPILSGGAGGTVHITGNSGYIGIMKNNIIYKVVPVSFAMDHTFFVDKDESGTIFEKAINRIKNYFSNTIDISLDIENAELVENDDDLNKAANTFLGTTGQEYTGYYTAVTIGNHNSSILIVETTKENLDVASIKSKDKSTNVGIETNSFEVAIDTIINVNNVTDADYVVKAENNNGIKLLNAYDINLKKMTDGSFINTINNGVEVYIPISGYKEGDKVKVYYIKTDSTIGETIEATVVKVEEKLYAKFTTTHFSTYAVENKTTISNPDTSDGIINSIIIISISLISLISITLYKKNEHDN